MSRRPAAGLRQVRVGEGRGEGRASRRMPLTAWHTVGAQRPWLLRLRFRPPAPSPTSDFPGPPNIHYLSARRRPPPSPVRTALGRSPSAAPRSSAPWTRDPGAARATPRTPGVPLPGAQQGPGGQRLGCELRAAPGGGSTHVPGAAGRDGKRKHGPRRAALGPGGAGGSAAAAAARTTSSSAPRRGAARLLGCSEGAARDSRERARGWNGRDRGRQRTPETRRAGRDDGVRGNKAQLGVGAGLGALRPSPGPPSPGLRATRLDAVGERGCTET